MRSTPEPRTARGRPVRLLLPMLFAVAVAACGDGPDAGMRAVSSDAAPVRRVRHTVESDGHPLAVWEKSPASPAAVVLLVHGRTWSIVPDFDLQVPGEDLSLMDGINQMGLAAYGVDLRGYGQTPRDPSGWNTPVRAAEDVAAVLAWVRQRHPGVPVHLFGWSLGSMVSQLTAQRSPELIDRLVLFGYPHQPGTVRSRQDPEGAPPMEATTAEGAASDFVTPGSISAGAIEAYVAAALEADPVRTDWTRGDEWNELNPEAVTVPTLVLQGEHDPLSRSPSLAVLFGALGTPDKSWVVVPGGDHAAFLESPRPYFLAVLESFLMRGATAQGQP